MDVPSVVQMRAAAKVLASHVMVTPIQSWQGMELEARLGAQTQVFLKLELFQRTGTFKVRAAMLNVLALSEEERRHGVTAVSAGNHAIAVACAAQRFGVSAKVVMLVTASALRIAAADEFVRAHPDGLQMRVAQGGINFSGGQRQRLAIARAVIRRPQAMISTAGST